MRYVTRGEAGTFELGKELGKSLKAGSVVLLRGDLGTGKSVIARGIAAARGVTCAMPSPTFVMMIPYEGDVPVYHFDLYRMGDPDEFYQSGFQEYVFGGGISLIEWPEMAELDIPGAVNINISRGESDDERIIETD